MAKSLTSVMIVEDEPDIREIVKIVLEKKTAFKLTFCTNGEEALQALKTAQPDLIILDMMMPVKDGMTTLKELKASDAYQNIPVIFMTAKVQSNEIENYLKLGAAGVITKPFDPIALPDKINEIWNKIYPE